MVLQRDRPIHIWGWSNPGERVSVELHGVSRDTAGDGLGNWSVFLPPESAGGPFQLTVTGSNKIVLDDILIGDVWFASGQSNMEFPLKGWPAAPMKDSAQEIAHAGQPQIRLLHIRQKTADFPLFNIDASWTVCTPETAADFSAVAYLFGRELNQREPMTIGLIDSTGRAAAQTQIALRTISTFRRVRIDVAGQTERNIHRFSAGNSNAVMLLSNPPRVRPESRSRIARRITFPCSRSPSSALPGYPGYYILIYLYIIIYYIYLYIYILLYIYPDIRVVIYIIYYYMIYLKI